VLVGLLDASPRQPPIDVVDREKPDAARRPFAGQFPAFGR
jgi:hypothetical protein